MIFLVYLVGGIFAIFATSFSFYQIYQHLLHYNSPQYQVHIIRILGMVPIYSVTSFLALVSSNQEKVLLLSLVRDSYEAYVIYNFLVLLIAFGGGERALVYSLELRPRVEHPWPVRCFLPPVSLGVGFMQGVRSACLQFVFVKPACALLLLHLKSHPFYFITYERGSVLTDLIINVSVSIALYALMLFYLASKDILQPFKPLPKFLAVKAVIFFSFWQGLAISIAVSLGIIHDLENSFSADVQATKIQDFLICVEMAVAAIAHHFVFSYNEYRHTIDVPPEVTAAAKRGVFKNFGDVVDFRDVLADAHSLYGGSAARQNRPFEREMRVGQPMVVTPVAGEKSALLGNTAGSAKTTTGTSFTR